MMSKKALVLIKTVVHLAIAGICILVLFAVIMKLVVSPLMKNSSEEAKTHADNAFSQFNKVISDMLNSPKTFDSKKVNILLPGDEYVYVGFGTFWDDQKAKIMSRYDDDGPIFRPSKCLTDNTWKACLCYYEGDLDEGTLGDREENLVDCQTFTDTGIEFSGYYPYDVDSLDNKINENHEWGGTKKGTSTNPYNPSSKLLPEDDIEYEYFVFYTDQASNFLLNNAFLTSGYQTFYIEKIVEGGTTHFLISPLYQELKKRPIYFSECSEESDDYCKSKRYEYVLAKPPEGNNQDDPVRISVCQHATNPDYLTKGVAYCKYDSIKNTCTATCALPCSDGQIKDSCPCGGVFRLEGYCYNDYYSTKAMSLYNFNGCADYCHDQQGLDLEIDSAVGTGGCSTLGKEFCEADPMRFNNCGFGSSQSGRGECRALP